MKRIVLFLTLSTFFINSDIKAQEVLDGMFIKETNPTRRVVPYTHIREADVMFYKRVWRVIDLREKMNHPLYFPTQEISEIGYNRQSLFHVLKKGIEEGSIQAYEEQADGGQFKVPLTKTAAMDKLSEERTGTDIDPETGLEIQTSYTIDVNANNVKEYWIKEDWVFDRERSVMEVRIIGILPIIEKENAETGQTKREGLFWIYFPEARYVLANQEVYNPNNDGERLTFEDYFRKRIFSSYIFRETNVYDNRVLEKYVKGVDRQLEASRIEEEIINFEHDLWQF